MLSNAGGRVGKVYGVYDEDAGVETRGRFLIDPDGVIQGYEVLTPPVGSCLTHTLAIFCTEFHSAPKIDGPSKPIQKNHKCSILRLLGLHLCTIATSFHTLLAGLHLINIYNYYLLYY